MKNFLQRAITGLLFVAALVGSILGGPLSFALLFSLISLLAIREFCLLVNKQPAVHVNVTAATAGALFLFLSFFYYGVNPDSTGIFIPYLLVLIYMMVSELYLKRENPIHNWAYAMLTQLYIALPFALLNVLAFHSDFTTGETHYNAILPLSIFIFNWVNDTGAYCTGMLFGKHRLFERISPKKSWEGSIGGAFFSIGAACVMGYFFPFLSMGAWIGLAMTIVVMGTWGDLSESLFKRQLGIKDSGTILPGHGGILDRFDSAILAIPAAVVYLYALSLLA